MTLLGDISKDTYNQLTILFKTRFSHFGGHFEYANETNLICFLRYPSIGTYCKNGFLEKNEALTD